MRSPHDCQGRQGAGIRTEYTTSKFDIQQRIDLYTPRHTEIAKLVKLLHSPLYKCRLSAQYNALEADRQGFLECILIGRRTSVVGYRFSGFAGP
jgi:hypothetical protein